MVESSPETVTRRFEAGQFASSEACVREYVKAMVKTNRIDRVDMQA